MEFEEKLNRFEVILESVRLIIPFPLSLPGNRLRLPSSVVPFSNILNVLPVAFIATHSSFLVNHFIATSWLLRTGNIPVESFTVLKAVACVIIESGKNLNSSDKVVDVRCLTEPLPIRPLLLMLRELYNVPLPS